MPETVVELDRRHLWHPFTQQREWCLEEPLVIERAEGSELVDSQGRRYIDGVSSLWCNVHGHRHPLIDRAVREQLDRVAHSTMLGLTHRGAAELAARLTALAPPGLSRVFYSDSGSSATEIALKMAFQYWRQRGGQHARRTRFVCLRGAYHGDTLGAVSVGGIDLFHAAYSPLLFGARSVDPGDAEQLERVLEFHAEEIAAVIVEPLVQGAAGVRVHPPGYLRAVRELTERYDVLLICDEVATGFGRTGTMFACEQERVAPDFLCLGKGLTGGYLPLAATLATERVYEGFLGAPDDGRTFFHGHTFTGNPLACAAALANLDAFESESTLLRLQPKIRLLGDMLGEVAGMPEVTEVRGRGFMVGIDLGEHDPALRLGHRVVLEARERGAIVRPLGDVVVLMPPLTIRKADLERLVEIVADSIRAAFRNTYGEPEKPAALDRGVAPASERTPDEVRKAA
jgi:adenosylmethionine-8-amino-7-oxononanoate aminotransferase